ncbi:MAG: pirin family protein [Betaproteobacteria bacterium]|jgi:redox-sensitive bicupin YhaK (pirin superfamily)
MQIRRSQERGFADHGWLKSYHSFSFANYYDPRFMGWGNLRVINEDRVAPGMGFGTHGHRDMEIISVVLSGKLAHQDSMGNVETIPAGDVQRMSAGTGVTHSEFNHSKNAETHFLQIWIEPNQRGIAPSYEQITLNPEDKIGQLKLIASSDRDQGGLLINADARLFIGQFDGAQTANLVIDPERKAYVHLIRGRLNVNGVALAGGDGLMIESEREVAFGGGDQAEVLLFDLAP